MDDDVQEIARRIRVARGEEPGDLLLAGACVINVFTESIERADVVIADGIIAGVAPPEVLAQEWTAHKTIDVSGRFIAPGLIDAHMHIESTLLTPAEFARLVVPQGTSAVIADPHEIGNVLGVRGIELMIAHSEGLPLDCYFMAPSCVPASPFENAGATLEANAIAQLLKHERVIGLAEMMNFPGVLNGDDEVLRKILAARRSSSGRGIVDGHAPGLVGQDLIAYAAANIRSDHECTTPEEALQRDALGMLVQVREGSMARNLDAMLPLIRDGRLRNWCLCTDDIHPEDLITDRHINGLLARLVSGGVDAATAVRHATLVPAQHYPLRDRGAVTPGYHADLAVFDDLKSFHTHLVLKHGEVVARDGEYLFAGKPIAIPFENTVHLGELNEAMFTLPVSNLAHPVIRIVPDQIVTGREERTLASSTGTWQFKPSDELALIACVQRHRPTGEMGLGLVSGFGFRRHGALGSTVGHDAHNLIITGTNPRDMIACARALAESGGGFAVVRDGKLVERMALPVAGLLSTESAEVVCRLQRAVNDAAASLGCPLHSPFGTLSFLALTVIPELRITDRGMFDVNAFRLLNSPVD